MFSDLKVKNNFFENVNFGTFSRKIASLFATVNIIQISFKKFVTKTTLFLDSIGRALVGVYKPIRIKRVSEVGP
jgi:hypothetical protein